MTSLTAFHGKMAEVSDEGRAFTLQGKSAVSNQLSALSPTIFLYPDLDISLCGWGTR